MGEGFEASSALECFTWLQRSFSLFLHTMEKNQSLASEIKTLRSTSEKAKEVLEEASTKDATIRKLELDLADRTEKLAMASTTLLEANEKIHRLSKSQEESEKAAEKLKKEHKVEVADLKQKIKTLEADLKTSRANEEEWQEYASGVTLEQFNNALYQVQVMNPGLVIDPSKYFPYGRVEGRKILDGETGELLFEGSAAFSLGVEVTTSDVPK